MKILFFSIIVFTFSVNAQENLTGTWDGKFLTNKRNNFYNTQSKAVLEIHQINRNVLAILTAYTLDSTKTTTYSYFGIINKKNNSISLIGNEVLLNETNEKAINFNLNCFFRNGVASKKMNGDCNTSFNNAQFAEFDFSKIQNTHNIPRELLNNFIKKFGDNNAIASFDNPSPVEERHHFSVDTIEVRSHNLTFQLFDIGSFDEDYVQIIYNEKIVDNNYLLKKEIKSFDLNVQENKLNILKIISIKEGTIPNTDILLNVFCDGIKHQYKFSVNGLVNANIFFKKVFN